MNNAFYLIFENSFGKLGKQLDEKAKLNFKMCDVTNWITITINILPGFSKCVGNQAVKYGQLI